MGEAISRSEVATMVSEISIPWTRLSRGAKFNGMACSVRIDSPVSRQRLTGLRDMSVPTYSAGLALTVQLIGICICGGDITHGG